MPQHLTDRATQQPSRRLLDTVVERRSMVTDGKSGALLERVRLADGQTLVVKHLTRVHVGRDRHGRSFRHGPSPALSPGSLPPAADSPRTARVQGCDHAPVIGQPEDIELGILGPLEVRVAGRTGSARA